MKQIDISTSKYPNTFTLVDDFNYEKLSRYKWHARKTTYGGCFAARTTYDGNKTHKVFMHRSILGLEEGDGFVADHINHNTLDNRISNIRKCTQAQNLCNRRADKNTSSKYKGVSWQKLCKKWDARISKGGIQHCLGLFETQELAAEAYNEKAKELHGEFANLNTIY